MDSVPPASCGSGAISSAAINMNPGSIICDFALATCIARCV